MPDHETDNRREAILSMVRIGDELRRGDRAIADLADLQAAIDAVCPDQWLRLRQQCAAFRHQRRTEQHPPSTSA